MNLNEWHNTGDRFSWRDQQVFYQEAGEGAVVFLLHGFLTSSWIFKLMWPALSKHFRVIAPDFVGFGFSSKPKKYPYGIDERVEMIYALADLLEVKECHIIAHSFGVHVTQEFLHRQLKRKSPIRLLSAAMLNGLLFSDHGTPSYRQRMMLNPIVGQLFAKFMGRGDFKDAFSRRVGKYSRFPEDILNDLADLLELNNGLSILHKLNFYLKEKEERKDELEEALLVTDVPIQLIWGIDKEDQIAGIRAAHKYRELKGDQYVVMLKDIGHFPLIECPEVVIEYYLNFIKGLLDLSKVRQQT